MTSNAIAYQKYLEDMRHNKEMEVQGREGIEIGKANAETAKQQVALGYSNLAELNRSNLAREAISEGQLAVSQQQVNIQQGQLDLQHSMAWPNLIAGVVSHVLPGVVGYALGQAGSSNEGSQYADTGWRLNGASTYTAIDDPFNF